MSPRTSPDHPRHKRSLGAPKPAPDPAIIAWLNSQTVDVLYLTATSLAELLVGVEITPSGRRKQALKLAVHQIVENLFHSRILPFDHTAAALYASIRGRARAQGIGISMADAQIAAIAQAHGFTVATRDVVPFAAVGTRLLNPWTQ